MGILYSIGDYTDKVEYTSEKAIIFNGIGFNRITYLCDRETGKHIVEHEECYFQKLLKTDFKTKREALEFIVSHFDSILINVNNITVDDILAEDETSMGYDFGARESLQKAILNSRYNVGDSPHGVRTALLGTSRIPSSNLVDNYTVGSGEELTLAHAVEGVPYAGDLVGKNYSHIELRVMHDMAQQFILEKKAKA